MAKSELLKVRFVVAPCCNPYCIEPVMYRGSLVVYSTLMLQPLACANFATLEFKEIRKEWKQRKKEEDAQRKAEEDRQRAAMASAQANGAPDQGPDGTPTSTYPGSRPVQLPPIGYQPASYPAPPSGGVPQQPLADYGGSHMYPSYQPHSPYGQPNQSMYSQCK